MAIYNSWVDGPDDDIKQHPNYTRFLSILKDENPNLYSEARRGVATVRVSQEPIARDPYGLREQWTVKGTIHAFSTELEKEQWAPKKEKKPMAKQDTFLMFASEIPDEKELWEKLQEIEFKDYTNGTGKYMLWILGLLSTDAKKYIEFVKTVPELTMKVVVDKIYDTDAAFKNESADDITIEITPAITIPRRPTGSTSFITKGMERFGSRSGLRVRATSPIPPVTAKNGMEKRPLQSVPLRV